MKRIIATLAALLLCASAHAQLYPLFGPANGLMKGSTTSPQTTTAAGTDVAAVFSGTCNSSTALLGDGTCGALNTVGTLTITGVGSPISACDVMSGPINFANSEICGTYFDGANYQLFIATPMGNGTSTFGGGFFGISGGGVQMRDQPQVNLGEPQNYDQIILNGSGGIYLQATEHITLGNANWCISHGSCNTIDMAPATGYPNPFIIAGGDTTGAHSLWLYNRDSFGNANESRVILSDADVNIAVEDGTNAIQFATDFYAPSATTGEMVMGLGGSTETFFRVDSGNGCAGGTGSSSFNMLFQVTGSPPTLEFLCYDSTVLSLEQPTVVVAPYTAVPYFSFAPTGTTDGAPLNLYFDSTGNATFDFANGSGEPSLSIGGHSNNVSRIFFKPGPSGVATLNSENNGAWQFISNTRSDGNNWEQGSPSGTYTNNIGFFQNADVSNAFDIQVTSTTGSAPFTVNLIDAAGGSGSEYRIWSTGGAPIGFRNSNVSNTVDILTLDNTTGAIFSQTAPTNAGNGIFAVGTNTSMGASTAAQLTLTVGSAGTDMKLAATNTASTGTLAIEAQNALCLTGASVYGCTPGTHGWSIDANNHLKIGSDGTVDTAWNIDLSASNDAEQINLGPNGVIAINGNIQSHAFIYSTGSSSAWAKTTQNGTFTATSSDFSPALSFTAHYTVIYGESQLNASFANVACITFPYNLVQGTSSTTTFSISGLPAVLRPQTLVGGVTNIEDNGTTKFGAWYHDNGTDQITFSNGPAGNESAFTASGTKGLPTNYGFTACYQLANE